MKDTMRNRFRNAAIWIFVLGLFCTGCTVFMQDATESDFARAVCSAYHGYNYLSVQHVETDRKAKTAVGYGTMYTNGGAYYIAQDVKFSLDYVEDGNSKQWVYREAPIVQERIGDYKIAVTSEIAGHYEIEEASRYIASFDIEQDADNSNLFTIKNFNAQIYNDIYNQWEEFTAENVQFSFRGSNEAFEGWWSGTGRDSIIADIEIDNLNLESRYKYFPISFQIANDTFYASRGGYRYQELKSGLKHIFSAEPSLWQGTNRN